MVKYALYAKEISWIIEARLQMYNQDNNFKKAVMEFDSSDMALDKQIIHGIMKLNNRISNNRYDGILKNDIEELKTILLKSRQTNIIEVPERLEALLWKAIEESKQIEDLTIKDFSIEEGSQYHVNLLALNNIIKINSYDDENEIIESITKKVDAIKPVTLFFNDERLIKGTVYIDSSNLNLKSKIKSVNRTDKSLEIIFENGNLSVASDDKISLVKRPENIIEEFEWCYVINEYENIFIGKAKQ